MMRVSLSLFALGCAALLTFGCSQAAEPSGSSSGGIPVDYSVPTATGSAGDPCASPNEGCPCTELGTAISCKGKKILLGTYVFCAGARVCSRDTGLWGACEPAVTITDADGGVSAASGTSK